MRRYLYILGLVVIAAVISTSCKNSVDLESIHQAEIAARDNYIANNNLENYKDTTGIYFEPLESSGDTTLVRAGFKAMLEYTITLLDGTVIYDLTTDDGYGHNYEPQAFYVDGGTSVGNIYLQQIQGMHYAVKKMHVGDRAFVVIPSELAFMAVDNSYTLGIPRFSTLLAHVYVKKAYSPEQLSQ